MIVQKHLKFKLSWYNPNIRNNLHPCNYVLISKTIYTSFSRKDFIMANLELYGYQTRPVDNPTPILVTSPATFVPVDQTTSGVTLAGVDLTVLRDSDGYLPSYPLLMKLFCKDVIVDNTGEFILSVTGSVAQGSVVVHRQDIRDFGLTWSLGHSTGSSWDTILNSDATVSLTPIAPMTTVKMNCILGIATNNIDRPEEN
jgi:hypothetical protein